MGAAARSKAVEETADRLYGLPHTRFVEERKAAAKALRAAGDKDAAKAVEALPRPSLSAWVVNQLYRQSEDELEALFAAADRMKRGDLDARDAHRDALTSLRGRAAQILVTEGHAASEGTLRRIATTLQALAVHGSFEPDAPGQLIADRDPPGFEAMLGADLAEPAPRPRRPEPAARRDGDGADAAAEKARQRAEAERIAAEKERQRAVERQTRELTRIESELAEARRVAAARERDIRDLSERLQRAEEARTAAETRAAELEDARARAAAVLVELTDARDSAGSAD
jgi:hypothetical protein